MTSQELSELARRSPPPDWWYDEDFAVPLDDDEPHEADGGHCREGMGRRMMRGGDEYDVHTGWRRLLCYTRRAGVTARVKRFTRRRERREGKRVTA